METHTDRRFGFGRIMLDANAEARRRGDRTVGTEHLALALLADPDSMTARALGVSVADARAAIEVANWVTSMVSVCTDNWLFVNLN